MLICAIYPTNREKTKDLLKLSQDSQHGSPLSHYHALYRIKILVPEAVFKVNSSLVSKT